MKLTRGNLFANRRSSRKVFSATESQLAGIICCILKGDIQGHPQCLKNTTMLGLPSSTGSRSLFVPGALVPRIGTGAISTGGGGGVAHDFSEFGTVRFANGFETFANGDAFGSFEPW